MICALVCANTHDTDEDTVTVTNASGTSLMTIEVGPNSTETVEAPWLADAGLIVASSGSAATTVVTVLWRPSV
jgi:hypothetical protein